MISANINKSSLSSPNLNRHENSLDSIQVGPIDPFPTKERIKSRSDVATKENLSITRKSNNMEKIHAGIELPSGAQQHGRWLQHVKRLKNGQVSSKLPLPSSLDTKPISLKSFYDLRVDTVEMDFSEVTVSSSSRHVKMSKSSENHLHSPQMKCDNEISVLDPFPVKERRQPRNNMGGKIPSTDNLHVPPIDNASPLPNNHPHDQWLQNVQKLKQCQKPSKSRSPSILDCKPKKRKSVDNIRFGAMKVSFSNGHVAAATAKQNHSENALHSLTAQNECDYHVSVADQFPSKERISSPPPEKHDLTNEKLIFTRRSDNYDKLHMSIVVPSGKNQHGRWWQHVRRLKYGQKSSKLQLPNSLDGKPMKLKSFGNFVSFKSHGTNSTLQDNVDQLQRPEASGAPRVTFHIETISNPVTGVSLHTTTSWASRSTQSSSYNSSTISSTSLFLDHSHHKCTKVKSRLLDKRTTEKCFWSSKEIQRKKARSRNRANSFRMDYPATVKQLYKVFLDTCNTTSTFNRDSTCDDDEDQEEMLRDFLRDWAASNVRGLEEMVTGRNIFTDTRKMAVQSVLAYQQALRENLGAAEVDRMADLLRARSESTSQRGRMFAMYLALGDALVANSCDNEGAELYDADISFNME